MINLSIIGNVGHDASLQELNSGDSFYKFSVGVSRGKDKPSQWVDVNLSRTYGDKIAQYIKKGTKIYVTGTPSVNPYTNRDNQACASLKLYATNIELLGSKNEDTGSATTNDTTPQENSTTDNELKSDVPF